MFRLPVTGFEVALRKPTGAEELLLHEKSSSSAELALEFVARVATRVGGESADWSALPVPDFGRCCSGFVKRRWATWSGPTLAASRRVAARAWMSGFGSETIWSMNGPERPAA